MQAEKVRIVIKEPNKDFQIIEVEKGYRNDTIEQFIPSLSKPYDRCDFVKCSRDGLMTVAVDEEGLLRELEPNFYIETVNYPVLCLVGTAVFTRVEYVNIFAEEIYDYTLTDLTDEDIDHIRIMLDRKYQNLLKNQFSKDQLKPIFRRLI